MANDKSGTAIDARCLHVVFLFCKNFDFYKKKFSIDIQEVGVCLILRISYNNL